MWRIWIVEIVLEKQPPRVCVFGDMGAYDSACEYVRDVRREANSRNKAVQVSEPWELTGEPAKRVNWKRR